MSFHVNSPNASQVTISNLAEKNPESSLGGIMKTCKILSGYSKRFSSYSPFNSRVYMSFTRSRIFTQKVCNYIQLTGVGP